LTTARSEEALLKKHAQEPDSVELTVKLADIYISRDTGPRPRVSGQSDQGPAEDFTNFAALPRSCGAKVNARTRSR